MVNNFAFWENSVTFAKGKEPTVYWVEADAVIILLYHLKV